MIFTRPLLIPTLLAVWLGGCRPEKTDVVAESAAILHQQPPDFIDQLSHLDALAMGEKSGSWVHSTLADSLTLYREHLRPLLGLANSDSEKVNLLNAWIFDSLGVMPVTDTGDLATSLPSQVLRNRQGSCLGISLLFLALGEALDMPLRPVFLPGHIFVRYRSKEYTRNVETLRKGLDRSDSFYRDHFYLARRPWYSLQEAELGDALAALVFNLANTHRSRGKRDEALGEYRLVEEALPGFPEALGNEGALLLEAGEISTSEGKLLVALAGDSLAEPAWRNLARIYREQGDTTKAAAWARLYLSTKILAVDDSRISSPLRIFTEAK